MASVATWPGRLLQPGEVEEAGRSWSARRMGEPRTTVESHVDSTRLPPRATPRVFQIGTLLDDRLRLRVPLEVGIEREGNFYIAKWESGDEFGYGHDPMAAVDDLRLSLAEVYWTLDKEQEKLGTDLAKVWGRLCEAVEKR